MTELIYDFLYLPTAILILIGVGVVSAGTDVWRRKIPNWLILTGLIAVLWARYDDFGWLTLKEGLFGLFIAFVITIPFVVFGALGAGDSKLMLVVGAALGATDMLAVFLIALVISGVLGLIGALINRNGNLFKSNLSIGLMAVATRNFSLARLEATQTAYRVPFAVPVLAGILVWLYWIY